MGKENVAQTPPAHSKGITTEQRARITQNFRAAKALLARKRPYEAVVVPQKNSSVNEVKSLAQTSRISRLPLAEIQKNTDSSNHSSRAGLVDREYNNKLARRKSVCGTDGSMQLDVKGTPQNLLSSECIITPSKKESSQCSYSGSYSSPSVLDEDLDETLLREIDALCEQQSTSKKERQGPCNDLSIQARHNFYDESDASPSNLKFVTTEKLLEDKSREVLMKEIDTFGEQQSTTKKEMQGSCKHLLVDVKYNLCEESRPVASNDLESVTAEKLLGHETMTVTMVAEPKDESPDSLGSAEGGCMPEAYFKYVKSLNEMQKEAACCDISIPLMIIAGPGSGKTSTMVGRVLTLLKEGICPANILAMTFTTAAASEMRDRIGAVTGKAVAKELTISTFHSFCLQLCRSHAEKLGRTSEFLIYGHGQQRRAVIEAVRLMEKERKSGQNCDAYKLDEDANDAKSFKDKSKKWQKFVTQAKASGKTPAEYQKIGDDIGAAILENYDNILRSCNALDYHDFISYSVKLLTDFPEVYNECRDRWRGIVVDEFQDTSFIQYSLLRILASHNCVTVVGDDDQSIFSFNGADICGFESFRKDFPMHKEIRLNKNYRSTGCIVEAASSLIHHNVKRCQLKQFVTDNTSGCKITVKECHNEDAQCSFVVDKILELIHGSSDPDVKCSLGSIAILYRRQVSGKAFQTSFRNRKIPFNVHGVAFYRKKVTKAIMAMLRTSLPGCDDAPFRQVFKVLLPGDKEEKKRVIDHIDKVSISRKCSFLSVASDIFGAKISGTFKRSQLTQGRKVLGTLDMIAKLVQRVRNKRSLDYA